MVDDKTRFGVRVVALGIAFLAALAVMNTARAGTWDEVYVNDVAAQFAGFCELFLNVEVSGVYSPETPWDAEIAWQLDDRGWNELDEVPGAGGTLGFFFTMFEDPQGDSTLYLRAVQSNPSGTFNWECYNYE